MRIDYDEPPFQAPWQAQAFALTIHLNERGVFTWGEWADALASERRRSAEAGTADDPQQYYLDWLRALETLLAERGVSGDELALFREAWTAAYKATPHGHPVRLDTGFAEIDGTH